jgi:hypothetical protein
MAEPQKNLRLVCLPNNASEGRDSARFLELVPEL